MPIYSKDELLKRIKERNKIEAKVNTPIIPVNGEKSILGIIGRLKCNDNPADDLTLDFFGQVIETHMESVTTGFKCKRDLCSKSDYILTTKTDAEPEEKTWRFCIGIDDWCYKPY
ncbi:MAG: hypothetical protein HQL06_08860 [Nitrospirae bacterium]|nr:hypothetical protein [Nitrospirota bacterium]